MNQNTSNPQTVEQYLPRIFKNWQERASKTELKGQTESEFKTDLSVNQSFIIDKQRLEEEVINRELQRVREEFLIQAKKIEDERLTLLETQMKEKYENDLLDRDDDIQRANRIINIQNAILSRVYEKDRDILLKILEDAEISEEDLKILSGNPEIE